LIVLVDSISQVRFFAVTNGTAEKENTAAAKRKRNPA